MRSGYRPGRDGRRTRRRPASASSWLPGDGVGLSEGDSDGDSEGDLSGGGLVGSGVGDVLPVGVSSGAAPGVSPADGVLLGGTVSVGPGVPDRVCRRVGGGDGLAARAGVPRVRAAIVIIPGVSVFAAATTADGVGERDGVGVSEGVGAGVSEGDGVGVLDPPEGVAPDSPPRDRNESGLLVRGGAGGFDGGGAMLGSASVGGVDSSCGVMTGVGARVSGSAVTAAMWGLTGDQSGVVGGASGINRAW